MKAYEINFITQTITMTKKFQKESQTIDTPAFNVLAQLYKEFPAFIMLVQENNRPVNKRLYPTYDDMMRVIRMNADDEAISEFRKVREEARACGNAYNMVRSWFFQKYSESYWDIAA